MRIKDSFKKIFFGWLAALAALALLFAYLLFFATPRPRIFYEPSGLHPELRRDYEQSLRVGAVWTRKADVVALRLTGHCVEENLTPIVDCSTPTKFDAFPGGENRITFIVLDDPLIGDDSVAGEEYRLDLARGDPPDGAWNIEWAGVRWRCHAERSGFGSWSRFIKCS